MGNYPKNLWITLKIAREPAMSFGRPQTLRFRLVLAAAGSILVALVLFGVATVVIVGHELRGSLDSALRQRAQEVAELAVSAPAVLTEPGALETPVSGRSIAVEVIDARGRILARSLRSERACCPRTGWPAPRASPARPATRTSTWAVVRSACSRRRSL